MFIRYDLLGNRRNRVPKAPSGARGTGIVRVIPRGCTQLRVHSVFDHRPVTRRGTTVTETLIALMILGTLVSILSPSLVRLARQRKGQWQVWVACEQLSNQLELLSRLSGPELRTAAATISLDEEVLKLLPGAELEAQVRPDGEVTRLRVSLTWRGPGGRLRRPLALTTWIYEQGGPPASEPPDQEASP